MPAQTFVVYRGARAALADLARQKGMPIEAVRFRIRAGWGVEAALDTPIRKKRVLPPVEEAAAASVDEKLEKAVRREVAPPWVRHPEPCPEPRRSNAELRALLAEAEAVMLATTAVDLRRRRVLEQLREWQGRV